MNKEIDEIANRVKEYCDHQQRYDEKLFNFGVELGRELERNNIQSYRASVFVEFEDKNNTYELLRNEFDRIESVFEFLIRTAIKKHIEKYGEFLFSKDFTCSKFDDEITEKFFAQITGVTQKEYGGTFEAQFALSGDVRELLKQYEIGECVRCDIENTSLDDYEIIYDTASIGYMVFCMGSQIDRRSFNWDLDKLKQLADKLEEKKMWLLLQI